MKLKIYSIIITLLIMTQQSFAVPQVFGFRGKILTADGQAPSSEVPLQVTFCIYSGETGGTPLWGRISAVKLDNDGSFFCELSDDFGNAVAQSENMSLSEALASSENLWMGLTPAGSSEISPRTRIYITPQAFIASKAIVLDELNAAQLKAGNITATNVVVNQDVKIGKLAGAGNIRIISEKSAEVVDDTENLTISKMRNIVCDKTGSVLPLRADTTTFIVWKLNANGDPLIPIIYKGATEIVPPEPDAVAVKFVTLGKGL